MKTEAQVKERTDSSGKVEIAQNLLAIYPHLKNIIPERKSTFSHMPIF